jgi:hypothetical protein
MIFYISQSKHNQQKTINLHYFPFVALVAIVVPIPSIFLVLHDKMPPARQQITGAEMPHRFPDGACQSAP